MTAAAPTTPPAAPGASGAHTHLSTYSVVAITLHWLIALMIMTNIGLAWYFGTLPPSQQLGSAPVQAHKLIGIGVLLLSVLRVVIRLVVPPPKLPASMPAWERLAARTSHLVFYGLMLGLPLTGWAMVSSSPSLNELHPIALFGVRWPLIPIPYDQLHVARKLFTRSHAVLAWVAYFTIALHICAALKHQLIDRDEVMARMIPFIHGRRMPS